MSAVVTPSAFGPMVAACDVEDRLEATLRRWLPSYVYEVERLHGYDPGTLPLPRSWVRSSDVEKMTADQLPAVMIGSPGITDPPIADGAGYYVARWQINLGVEIIARSVRPRALDLARLYALALRGAAIQQANDETLALPPLGIVRVEWIDERYDRLDSIDDRTVCIAEVELVLEVAEVLKRNGGPVDPLLPPQGPSPESPTWPIATSTDVQITKSEEDA
jgi:hypothetical protein